MSINSSESLGFHTRMSQLDLRLKKRNINKGIKVKELTSLLKAQTTYSDWKFNVQSDNEVTFTDMSTVRQELVDLIPKTMSEDERIKLEERFNQLLQNTKSEESKQLFQLRENYCQLLQRDRLRCERNDLILRTLNRIENRTSTLAAKTDRLRLLRQYYESYIDHICSNRKRSDTTNLLGSINDLSETSPSLRPPSPTISLFSSSPVPLFTSTPSTTRRSSLVVPDLDLESSKCKFASEMGSSSFPTRRKLLGNSIRLRNSSNNEKKSDSKAYTENIEATQFKPNIKVSKDFSEGGNLQLSPSTMDLEPSTYNDLLQLSLTNSDPDFLPKNKSSSPIKVDTMKPKTNYLSSLLSPNIECKQSDSILRENKPTKTTARSPAKPLVKSCSFNAASPYLNKPDRFFSTERRSNLIRRPTFAYRSTVSSQPTERSLSSKPRISSSALSNRSKSPLRVVDDIFKKYLINYDKRYLSDPISESKYGKYLYPSRNYEVGDKTFEEPPRQLFDSNYNNFKHVPNKKEMYLSSKESISSNHYDLYASHEPVYKSMSKSIIYGSDVDSPRSTYSNDWKDWDHYRNRYEYTTDDDIRNFQSMSSHEENAKYPNYVSRTTYEDRDSVPQIHIDSSNINYLDRIDPYYKPFDYQRSKYSASKTYQDQNLPEKWYSDDTYASLSAETPNRFEQSLKVKDSTKTPQTPKKVSFSNEFLYDDRFDLEADSLVDETISQDTDNIHSKSVQNEDFIQSIDSNCNSKHSKVNDHQNYLKTSGHLASYQNEIKDAVLKNKTNLSDPPHEHTVRNGEQCLTSTNCVDEELGSGNQYLRNETDNSINSKIAENQIDKESVAATTKIENYFDLNVTEFSKPDIESKQNIVDPNILGNETKSNINDDKSLNQIISNEIQDSNLRLLQKREVTDTSNDVNEENIQSIDLTRDYKEQSYKIEPKVRDSQENVSVNNDETHTLQNILSQESKNESNPTDQVVGFVDGGVDSQQVMKQYEGNIMEDSNLEGRKGIEQNVLYGDINSNQNTLQGNEYVDQSHQDKMMYGDTNLPQYNANYEQVHYDSSQPQYEQQVTKGYNDDSYTKQSIPEYDQVQGTYETDTYIQENVSPSHQKPAEVYDNQYPESAYEQPVNYDTESYRQDYEQPVEEPYHPTDYQQEQYVKEGEQFSPSHYQSEPGREYATEQYQEEYPQQPGHYETDYQNPAEEAKQQFEANYDPAYQKEPHYNYDNPEAVSTEHYDQYDQEPYTQYEQQQGPQQFDQYNAQPQLYDQYDQQSKEYDGYEQLPQSYDQQPKDYDGYEQPPQPYEQQPKDYDGYEQPPQPYDQQPKDYDGYEQPPQLYDQQPKDYDGYEQPPQPYDQQPKDYDGYEQPPQPYDQQPAEYNSEYVQQPQQYIPYEPEQQQPHDQYNQQDPGNYDQYEHQQNEQYGSQYQGEPDQFGNVDYNYDGQNVNTDQVYRGDEQLAYSDQPQNYGDNLQHTETAQQPYDRSPQLPYEENIQSSYEGPEQAYSEIQVKYEGEKHSYEDLSRSNQEPPPQTVDVTQSLNKPGKPVQESIYDTGAERVYSDTADSKAAPNLNRVLESDSESARTQDPLETHENSSDFDFSSGPK